MEEVISSQAIKKWVTWRDCLGSSPSVEVVWSCRKCLRAPSPPYKFVIHVPFRATLGLQYE